MAERAAREGSPLGATPKVLKERIEWLADEHEVEIALDRPAGRRAGDALLDRDHEVPGVARRAREDPEPLGVSWTLSLRRLRGDQLRPVLGQPRLAARDEPGLIDAAVACKAKTLVLPECGHAYGAMRWQGANMYGKPLPFRVLHISEFLAEPCANGRLKLEEARGLGDVPRPLPGVAARRRRRRAARRAAALGAELRETRPTADANWCCGGGGGVVTLHRADEHRYRAFEIKMKQVDATGAERLATSCANCRLRPSTTGRRTTSGTGRWRACSSSSPSTCATDASPYCAFGAPGPAPGPRGPGPGSVIPFSFARASAIARRSAWICARSSGVFAAFILSYGDEPAEAHRQMLDPQHDVVCGRHSAVTFLERSAPIILRSFRTDRGFAR